MTSIEQSVFSGCSGLKSVSIPEGVTSIGYDAFSECSGLTGINVAAENGSYVSEDGVLYDKEKANLICCPGGKTGAIVIPKGVTSIGDYAFSGCGGLTGVNIPEGVTSIGKSAFSECGGLTSVNIPEGVTSIKDSTFSGCGGLTSVNIPESVTRIEYGAFSMCNGLKDAHYAGSQEQWKKITIGDCNEPLLEVINGASSGSGNTGTGGSGSGAGNSGSGGSSGSDTGGSDKETSKKSDQSVTANDLTKTYGVKPFPLGAKSSAGATLSYEVSDPKIATVDASGKVTIKGCGIVSITITAAETSTYKKAQKTVTLTVKPKTMTLSSVKSQKKKTAIVKWKKDQKASGYIIECATDSKFKKNKVKTEIKKNKTTNATMKKLKAGKKYYVRICAYAKSGKTKLQGDWSKAKTVRVKK